jgi:putative serine protease PepD
MRTTSSPGVAVIAALLAGLAACSGSSSTGGSQPGPAAAATPSSQAAVPTPAASASGAGPASSAAALQGLENAYTALVKQTLPSVIEIRTPSGLGSGVVFDDQGDVVTNAHVVGDATSFQVVLAGNNQQLPARLVGTYPPDDLAVIKLTGGRNLHPARFGDSATVAVGDIVLAMGSPLGLSSSVTNGIVSAVGRTVSEPADASSPGAVLPQAIQTSAPINPGNSGGALVDISGQVIGLPTLAAVDPQIGQGGSAAPGIGFAVPSNIVRDIAGQLIATGGRVTNSHRAALGISVAGLVDPSGNPQGVGVQSVRPGGPADRAGIQAGDVITSVAGQQVPDPATLSTVLATLTVGQTVPVVLQRGGASRTVQVTLGNLGS